MKLKETLNLGQTAFAMRANLPNKEVELQKIWDEARLYEQIQTKNLDQPTFILHDGPPFANGKVHMGHALNKISKDFIVRYKSMSGYRAPFVPGWDTHGLPIETALQKNNKINRKEISISEFREMCEEYAMEQIASQKTDFMRMGISGDWQHPYITLQPEFEAQQLRAFAKMTDRNIIYKGLKPIYWSPSSESSLAEAEVEYQDVTSPSIYVAFKVKDGKDILPKEAEFIIWTTTPWTLPANLGISAAPMAEYVLVSVGNQQYVLAQDLLEEVAEKLSWETYEINKRFKGQDLEYMTAHHPFYDRESLVMVGDHVTLDSGTGLVHTAPGHGVDDYMVGMKYGLNILSPIDHRGHFTEEAPGLEGMFYLKGQKAVLEIIKENGSLLHYSEFVHSYPHDWRTKKPVIYRATPQWFASIDIIRQDILDIIENDVQWLHPSGQTRIFNMIRDRGDWVISRQRSWGVPLPIFYAEDGSEILDPTIINHVADLVEKHGTNIWFEWDVKDLLPTGYTHPKSPNGIFTQETDIMDVWFDSGTSYAGVLQNRDDLSFPADLYLEGSDQYRGWFNSSITTSVAVNHEAPYKSILSQGFVMDGKGQKMSKSIGNVILPEDIMKQYGADIIRLWVSSVDYESDVRISDEILKQVSESYRKIRNTIRFMLSNIHDFNPEIDSIAEQDLSNVDQFMLAKFKILVNDILEAYENYQFSDVYKKVINFITVDLSAFYLDFAKDIVYIEAAKSSKRLGMQTVIYHMLKDLIRLLTPILVHTMEEAWEVLPGSNSFVQLQEMPAKYELTQEYEMVKAWDIFFDLQSSVRKALEVAKNNEEDPIKKSFEASVTVFVDNETKTALTELDTKFDQLLIVSNFELKDEAEASADSVMYDKYKVEVKRAQGHVCDRCRAVRPEVGTIEDAPNLCHRCHEIVAEHYPTYFEEVE